MFNNDFESIKWNFIFGRVIIRTMENISTTISIKQVFLQANQFSNHITLNTTNIYITTCAASAQRPNLLHYKRR